MCTSTSGGLVHPRYRVAVEIGLLNTAVLQSNLAVKGCGDTKNNPAFNLGLDGVGVNDDPQSTAHTTCATNRYAYFHSLLDLIAYTRINAEYTPIRVRRTITIL